MLSNQAGYGDVRSSIEVARLNNYLATRNDLEITTPVVVKQFTVGL